MPTDSIRALLDRRCVRWCVAIAAASAWPAEGLAQTRSEMAVSLELAEECTVSAENLDFGTLEAPTNGLGSGSAQTTITVDCPDTQRYSISLGAGLNPDGVSRNLGDSEGNLLRYEIYQPPRGSELWGDDVRSSPIQGSSLRAVGTGSPEIHPVYADLFAPARAPAGSYSDRVTVYVEF